MNILKKCLANSVATTLLTVAFFSTASAAGPVGVPPTQNVSPTFSDVNVLGNLSVVKDLLIGPVADSVFSVVGNIITIGSASNASSLNINAKIFLNPSGNDGNGGQIYNVNTISDKTDSPSKLELISGAAYLALRPTSLDGSPRIEIAGKLENILSSTLEILDNLTVLGQKIIIQDPFFPTGQLALTHSSISTSNSFPLSLNEYTGQDVITGSNTKKTNLTVNGHLRADSVGRYVRSLTSYIPLPVNGTGAVNGIACPATDQIIVSCGFNFYQDLVGTEYVGAGVNMTALVAHPNGDQNKCAGKAFNSSASIKYVQLNAICFDPNGI